MLIYYYYYYHYYCRTTGCLLQYFKLIAYNRYYKAVAVRKLREMLFNRSIKMDQI